MAFKAIKIIGISSSIRFIFEELLKLVFLFCIFPPMRSILLRILGAKVGKGCIIHRFEFINLYRGSFRNLSLGDYCFIGNRVLFDLADKIALGNHVTVSERVTIMTHLNVGYPDHPLQPIFPSNRNGVSIGDGSFVGVNATVLSGVTIGPKTFVAAGAVVNKSIDGSCLVGGVPARPIRSLN